MANEDSKKFSYMDIMQNPVMTGKAVGKIWTGFPDIKYLDNDMVIIDEAQRKKLIEEITKLEKYTRNIRNTKKGLRLDARVDAERLFVNLFENEYMNPNALAIVWIRTYQDIKNENPQEFSRIPEDAKRNLEMLERSMDGKAANREVYDEKSRRYKAEGIFSPSYEKKYVNYKNRRNVNRLANYMGQFYSEDEKAPDENLVNDLIEILNTNFTLQELLIYFIKEGDYDLGHAIINATYNNALLLQGYTPSQIEELTNEESNDLVISGEEKDEFAEGYSKLKLDTVLEYLDFMDLDKYFISYAIKEFLYFDNMGNYPFNKEGWDEKSIFDTDVIDINNVFQRMEFLMRFLSEADRKGIIDKSTEQTFYFGNEPMKFNYSEIKRKMNCYSGMIYLTPETYEAIRPFLYSGDEAIWGENKNVKGENILKSLKISDTDKKLIMATDCSAIERLYEIGLVDKEDIKRVLREIKTEDLRELYCETVESMNISSLDKDFLEANEILEPSEIAEFLLRKDIFSNEDIKSLYEEDVLDLEGIEETGVAIGVVENWATDEELLNSYRDYIKAMLTYRRNETPENKEALSKATLLKNKIMTLYKKYKLEGMTPEQKTENAEELILSYYSDLDLESQDDNILEALREMYKDRIVNFESINNSDPKMLQDLLIDVMLKRGELTLDDTIKLKRTFPIEKQKAIVEEALQDDTISENEKFILVMNMFFENTKEDTLARYEFLKRFRASQFIGSLNPKFINGEMEEPSQNSNSNPNSKDWNKYVYPDNIKWLLFMNIDKDAMPTKYDNGYVEFYLPKFNVRVIEKYYDVDYRTNKIKGPTYGVATYVMSDEKFRTENDSLVGISKKGGAAINERNLRKIVPRKDRVSHVTQSADRNWMRSLTEKLGIDFTGDTRYTKQELENLENVIETYENCYERY